MALRNFCGFELGDNVEASTVLGGAYSTTTKRTGTYAWRCNTTTTGFASFQIGSMSAATGSDVNLSVADVWIRVYFRYADKPDANDEPILAFFNTSSAVKMEVRLGSDDKLAAYDSTPTVMATGATVLSADTWYLIEVRCGTGAAANWEVKINGVSEISGTGNLTTTNHGRVYLGKHANRNSQVVDFFYDDYAVSDSAYLGAGQCEVMVPNADGSTMLWTGGDFSNVDEIPADGDTTHLLSTLVIDEAALFGLESAASAGISGTINAVKSLCIIKRDNAEAANGTVSVRLRSGGTNANTSDIGVGSAYIDAGRVYETDPADAGAWTTADLDALEVGVVERETTNKTRVTLACVMVDFVPAAGGGQTIDMWGPRYELPARSRTQVVPSGTTGIKAAA